jgi:hypothetical protein
MYISASYEGRSTEYLPIYFILLVRLGVLYICLYLRVGGLYICSVCKWEFCISVSIMSGSTVQYSISVSK